MFRECGVPYSRLPLFCVWLCCLAPACLWRLGQDVKGSVRGTVTDEQGAAVPGAEVTISDPSTGFSRSGTTGNDGVYNFPDLPLGTFKIRVTHAGFKASEQVGVVVHASDSLVFNFALTIGAVTESVTVEAYAIQVETTNGELSA